MLGNVDALSKFSKEPKTAAKRLVDALRLSAGLISYPRALGALDS